MSDLACGRRTGAAADPRVGIWRRFDRKRTQLSQFRPSRGKSICHFTLQ